MKIRRYATVLVACAGVLAASACTIPTGSPDTNVAVHETLHIPPAFTVGDGATVQPNQDIEVHTFGAELVAAKLVNDADEVVAELGGGGKVSSDTSKSSWRLTEPLGYGRTYTLTARDSEGQTVESTFTTVTPTYKAEVYVSPDGAEVGVGQTVNIQFDTAIADEYKEEAERTVTVTADPPTEGAFYWVNQSQLRWRPKEHWHPGTKVHVEAKPFGHRLGKSTWGGDNAQAEFTIGDEVISYVDNNTKIMTVTKNGETIKTMPVSMGRDGGRWSTPPGTYIIGDKNPSMIMDSETFGLSHEKGGYRTKVNYATQMSYSGIYVHAAPWSVWAQGNTNTSHGCINVSTENAKWFQEFVKRGDLVVVTNTTGETFSPYDGLGDWNFDWATISKDSSSEDSSSS
ncbi:L,D-transpeptidase family protein [Corynebacterium glucuronolyticum]|uniref:L,D-transpeptidase family protein n=1 Tax=Corynebacterium glucuronolyticum TaxID=39791 RepID=A0A7T4EHE7_9CORY|nr:Ig-like domain-containing protein [Corynebacterium glucuronolyticum]QQB47367.1 L,D-transpeptidase family protein [Corynebacterium glucuronolyticum]WKD64300.1 Putative L,D-transpeptidase LppS precursor [Corynebacterium glucuronolyticum DSM 44120]SMB78352.1 Lipoprotein-anchoring transpeptidase ErfK/SrfK [Corynebacterium glucuronolyticum]